VNVKNDACTLRPDTTLSFSQNCYDAAEKFLELE